MAHYWRIPRIAAMPEWVPDGIQFYLMHTVEARSIRAIARDEGLHASTVLRQIRRIETRRDDPLVDCALRRLGRPSSGGMNMQVGKEVATMTTSTLESRSCAPKAPISDAEFEPEARRILRRLCEPGSVLALVAEMETAVVVRDSGEGESQRTASVGREVAEALALKEWISSTAAKGKVVRYQITAAGRSALKRLLAEAENRALVGATGLIRMSANTTNAAPKRLGGADEDEEARRNRYSRVESPLTCLARRKDKDGKRFLSDDLVSAGERLREDFELAQMLPDPETGWEAYITDVTAPAQPEKNVAHGPEAANARVKQALRDLGPGLGDVVLQCCCHLEGLETAEKKLGWAARSGKIVLRIALQRLKRHYDTTHGRFGAMIG